MCSWKSHVLVDRASMIFRALSVVLCHLWLLFFTDTAGFLFSIIVSIQQPYTSKKCAIFVPNFLAYFFGILHIRNLLCKILVGVCFIIENVVKWASECFFCLCEYVHWVWSGFDNPLSNTVYTLLSNTPHSLYHLCMLPGSLEHWMIIQSWVMIILI